MSALKQLYYKISYLHIKNLYFVNNYRNTINTYCETMVFFTSNLKLTCITVQS